MELPPNLHRTADYILFEENGDILALNGKTGNVELSGTDLGSVMNSAMSALAEPGKIYIAPGVYTYSTTIDLSNAPLDADDFHSVNIQGAGVTNTRLKNEGCVGIECSPSDAKSHFIHLHDFDLFGDGSNTGIRFTQDNGQANPDSQIWNIWVKGQKPYGIELDDFWGWRIWKTWIELTNAGTTGIIVTGVGSIGEGMISGNSKIYAQDLALDLTCKNSVITNCTISQTNAGNGVRLRESYNLLENNVIYSGTGKSYAVYVNNQYNTISGNRINAAGGIGVDVDRRGNQVLNNRIEAESEAVRIYDTSGAIASNNHLFSQIRLYYSDGCQVVGNRLDGANIYAVNPGDRVAIVGNNINLGGAGTGIDFNDGRTHSVIKGNIVYDGDTGILLRDVGTGCVRNVIDGNVVYGMGTEGITLQDAEDYNMVSNNNTPDGISTVGTNTITDNNISA